MDLENETEKEEANTKWNLSETLKAVPQFVLINGENHDMFLSTSSSSESFLRSVRYLPSPLSPPPFLSLFWHPNLRSLPHPINWLPVFHGAPSCAMKSAGGLSGSYKREGQESLWPFPPLVPSSLSPSLSHVGSASFSSSFFLFVCASPADEERFSSADLTL